MRPSEVKALFSRVDDTHLEVKQNVQVDYNVGDVLDVIAGPLSGQQVTVTSVQGSKILGQINLLGRSIPAEFTVNQVYRPES
jgi:transcription antitermination factor NusG